MPLGWNLVAAAEGTQALQLAGTIVLGVAAQWLASKLRQPSILFLLLIGLLAGPISAMVLGDAFIKPDELFGDSLLPLVSLAVGIILFEGGLTLKFADVRELGGTIISLTTVGAIVTGLLAGLAAYFLFGLTPSVAAIIGAILTVTGPTVIVPLLRAIQPNKKVANLLQWEGIIIDPIGAMFAVLVFEAVVAGEGPAGSAQGILYGVLATVAFGALFGLLGGMFIQFILRRYWVPDFLQNAFTLMVVVGCFAASNHFAEESGLFAVTLMGMYLANQHKVDVREITEFKETLRVLFIAAVFVILAARITPTDLEALLDWRVAAFLGALILVIRPLAVFASSIGSKLSFKEKTFLSAVAPRGIVAAAVSSIFALRLAEADGINPQVQAEAERIVPIIFAVILGTVIIYGFGAGPVAKLLGLSSPKKKGVVILGAQSWALDLAAALKASGFSPLLVDSNASKIAAARSAGFEASLGSVFDDYIKDKMAFAGIGWAIAATSNDSVNTLAAHELATLVSKSRVFQVYPAKVPDHMAGRLFGNGEASYSQIMSRISRGHEIRAIEIEEATSYGEIYQEDGSWLPLFVAPRPDELLAFTPEEKPPIPAGSWLIALAPEGANLPVVPGDPGPRNEA